MSAALGCLSLAAAFVLPVTLGGCAKGVDGPRPANPRTAASDPADRPSDGAAAAGGDHASGERAAEPIPPKRVLAPPYQNFSAVRFSPDGRLLGVAHTEKYARSIGVRLFPVGVGGEAESEWLPAEADDKRVEVVSLAFSPDGEHVAAGVSGGDISVWDLKTRERRRFAVARFYVFDLAFAPDGESLYAAVHGGVMRFAFPSGRLLRTFVVCDGVTDIGKCGLRNYGVDVSPDGRRVAAGSIVWEADTGKESAYIDPAVRPPFPFAARFLPDGRSLAVAGLRFSEGDGKLVVGGRGGRPASRLFDRPLGAMALLPGGREAVVGGDDGLLSRVRLEGLEVTATYGGFEGMVRSVAVSPEGATVAASGDGGVIIWDVSAAAPKTPLGPAGAEGRP